MSCHCDLNTAASRYLSRASGLAGKFTGTGLDWYGIGRLAPVRLPACTLNLRRKCVCVCAGRYRGEEGEALAATQARLQGYLKEAVELLFDTTGCTEVVGAAGDFTNRQAANDAPPTGPSLVWSAFFCRTIPAESTADGASGNSLPGNVYVATDARWGDLDFDAATAEAQRIFHRIWPAEPFLPALPDPNRVHMQEEEQLLLETEGARAPRGQDYSHTTCVAVVARV